MTKGFLLGIAGVLVGAAAIGLLQKNLQGGGIGGSFAAMDTCDISTSTTALVGPSSRVILATTSRRAWATISASSTLYIGLGGRPAVSRSGIMADEQTGASTSVFKIDANNSFTGEVAGLMPSGSSSVLVTECVF